MAMQAFAIVERRVELDILRLRNFPQILHVDVMQAAPFCMNVTEHRVIRVARKACVVTRDQTVLKMHCWNIAFVVEIKAFAIIGHDMARETKLS